MLAYIINLDSATQRWDRVAGLMANTGIAFERVSAVYGRELQLPIAEFSEAQYRRNHGKRPNFGQIGCFLSHIKTMKLFLQTDAEHAMIFEDDISPDPQLKQIIAKAIEYSDQWDILRLCGFHNAHPTTVCELSHQHRLCVNLTRLCGTGCYVVSRHAAQVLIDQMLPMRVPIDHAIDREWFYGLTAMAIDPLPVRQNPPDLPSSLPAENNEKLPAWQRYWGVFPYRAINESTRFYARLKLLIKARRAMKARRNTETSQSMSFERNSQAA